VSMNRYTLIKLKDMHSRDKQSSSSRKEKMLGQDWTGKRLACDYELVDTPVSKGAGARCGCGTCSIGPFCCLRMK